MFRVRAPNYQFILPHDYKIMLQMKKTDKDSDFYSTRL